MIVPLLGFILLSVVYRYRCHFVLNSLDRIMPKSSSSIPFFVQYLSTILDLFWDNYGAILLETSVPRSSHSAGLLQTERFIFHFCIV